MAYRYTNTDKWTDSWFSELKPAEKLLFTYLCDNCDMAGFIEINLKRWAVDIGYDRRGLEGALKGLRRGLIFSTDQSCVYIKNFLKHQKNLPLNAENKAHKGILKRFEIYRDKFGIENIIEFIEGASKGLPSPYGNGNGIGIGKEEGGTGETKSETRFTNIPPSLTEIQARMNERGITSFTAEAFYAYYVSIGWKVGNKTMKNWDAALTTWQSKQRTNGSSVNGKPKTLLQRIHEENMAKKEVI